MVHESPGWEYVYIADSAHGDRIDTMIKELVWLEEGCLTKVNKKILDVEMAKAYGEQAYFTLYMMNKI